MNFGVFRVRLCRSILTKTPTTTKFNEILNSVIYWVFNIREDRKIVTCHRSLQYLGTHHIRVVSVQSIEKLFKAAETPFLSAFRRHTYSVVVQIKNIETEEKFCVNFIV